MKQRLRAAILSLGFAAAVSAQTVVLDDFNSATVTGGTLAGTSWVDLVTQNPTTITVAGNALDDNGWGVLSTSLDATGMNFITITAQRDTGNVAASLVIGFEDITSSTQIFSVPTSSFASGSLTTVQIPIVSWLDFDPTEITAWNIGGGIPPPGLDDFRMTFDNLSFSAAAIPEPSTYAAIAGVLALGFVAWRRRSTAGAASAIR